MNDTHPPTTEKARVVCRGKHEKVKNIGNYLALRNALSPHDNRTIFLSHIMQIAHT